MHRLSTSRRTRRPGKAGRRAKRPAVVSGMEFSDSPQPGGREPRLKEWLGLAYAVSVLIIRSPRWLFKA